MAWEHRATSWVSRRRLGAGQPPPGEEAEPRACPVTTPFPVHDRQPLDDEAVEEALPGRHRCVAVTTSILDRAYDVEG
ncbi:hypothetical protein ACWEFJ_09260 [Actinosynnema sp. NPDC004786]